MGGVGVRTRTDQRGDRLKRGRGRGWGGYGGQVELTPLLSPSHRCCPRAEAAGVGSCAAAMGTPSDSAAAAPRRPSLSQPAASPLPVGNPGSRSSGQAAMEATCPLSISQEGCGLHQGRSLNQSGCGSMRIKTLPSTTQARAPPGFSGHITGGILKCSKVKASAGSVLLLGALGLNWGPLFWSQLHAQKQDADGPVELGGDILPPAVAGALWQSQRSPQPRGRTWCPGWS